MTRSRKTPLSRRRGALLPKLVSGEVKVGEIEDRG